MKRPLLSPIALAVLLVLGGCAPPPPPPPLSGPVALPDTGEVERVVFLLGDAGDAQAETSPVLARLREDVEHWSARLPHDSAVAVLVLGDNVYPTGLQSPPSRATPQCSWIRCGWWAVRRRARTARLSIL